jgi:hypothetical protein
MGVKKEAARAGVALGTAAMLGVPFLAPAVYLALAATEVGLKKSGG